VNRHGAYLAEKSFTWIFSSASAEFTHSSSSDLAVVFLPATTKATRYLPLREIAAHTRPLPRLDLKSQN
jgi:hypothetical protein